MNPQTFIDKWTGVATSELATSQSFLLDLCELLAVDKPHPDIKGALAPTL